MKVEVWSDVACPFCWLGKAHLQAALRNAGVEADVEFRSFELAPAAGPARPVREYLEERYGAGPGIDASQARLRAQGAAVGLAYDFERMLMANTFDAHRVHHLAKARGLGEALMERLLRAHHGEGADVSDHATLRRIAGEAGLDGAEVESLLMGDAYATEVRADEALARKYGIRGVPFFVFDGRLALSGAHPVEVFEEALRQVKAQAPRV